MSDNNTINNLIDDIHFIKENISKISSFITELKREYAVLEDKIELSSSDVMQLLGISRATLWRWRDANVIPYRYVSCNHVLYSFKGLYIAVKTGRATYKGFKRLNALQKLNAYKEGILKGYVDNPELVEEL